MASQSKPHPSNSESLSLTSSSTSSKKRTRDECDESKNSNAAIFSGSSSSDVNAAPSNDNAVEPVASEEASGAASGAASGEASTAQEEKDSNNGLGRDAPVTKKARCDEKTPRTGSSPVNESNDGNDNDGNDNDGNDNDGNDANPTLAPNQQEQQQQQQQQPPPKKAIFGSSSGFTGFQTATLPSSNNGATSFFNSSNKNQSNHGSGSIFGSSSTSGFGFASGTKSTSSIFGQNIKSSGGFGSTRGSSDTSDTSKAQTNQSPSTSIFGSGFISKSKSAIETPFNTNTNDTTSSTSSPSFTINAPIRTKTNTNATNNNTATAAATAAAATTAIIPQPTEPISNGEENEETIYTIRAKLYKLKKVIPVQQPKQNQEKSSSDPQIGTRTGTGIQWATKVGNDSCTNNDTHETQQQKVDWREVGIGPLKILVSSESSKTATTNKDDNDDDGKYGKDGDDTKDTKQETAKTTTARIVQRRESTPGGPGTKLILNVVLQKECVVEKCGEKFVKLAAFEAAAINEEKSVDGASGSDGDGGKDSDDKEDFKLQTVQYLFKVKTISEADSLLDELKKYCK